MLSNKSNKELVEAGHQFAKALDADMPLTEIAKLVSALSTRLDCAIVRGNELQKKLDALIEIFEKSDNRYCMCGSEIDKKYGCGCGHTKGMLDYRYAKWIELYVHGTNDTADKAG